MKLMIQELSKEKFEIDFPESSLVKDLKEQIQSIKGYEVEMQKLILRGKILLDEFPLSQYQVRPGSKLFLYYSPPVLEPPEMESEEEEEEEEEDDEEVEEVKYEEQLLIDMGYSLEQSRQSMDENNQDFGRALESLLMDGVPHSVVSQAANPFEFLMESPEFTRIAEIIRQEPNQLEHFIDLLESQNPELYRLVCTNQNEFLQFIGVDSNNQLQLSQQEEDEIRELMELGFSAQLAVEAYLRCQRNKERAADLLFSRQI